MKKILLTFIVLLSVAALAKGPITVNVKEGSENTEVQSFLELFDAGVATVSLSPLLACTRPRLFEGGIYVFPPGPSASAPLTLCRRRESTHA